LLESDFWNKSSDGGSHNTSWPFYINILRNLEKRRRRRGEERRERREERRREEEKREKREKREEKRRRGKKRTLHIHVCKYHQRPAMLHRGNTSYKTGCLYKKGNRNKPLFER
jgi:hypothetical protein